MRVIEGGREKTGPIVSKLRMELVKLKMLNGKSKWANPLRCQHGCILGEGMPCECNPILKPKGNA